MKQRSYSKNEKRDRIPTHFSFSSIKPVRCKRLLWAPWLPEAPKSTWLFILFLFIKPACNILVPSKMTVYTRFSLELTAITIKHLILFTAIKGVKPNSA